jgi:glycosyltransferase involved in cell wall biosynthesis
MRISALVPNLATNGIVRSWPILKVLERHHEVKVIGALFGDEELFPPYSKEFAYHVVKWQKQGRIADGIRKTLDEIDGDVVYSFKALTASFGAALVARRRRGVKVIIDLEDLDIWELYRNGTGLPAAMQMGRQLVGPGWRAPHSLKYRLILDRLVRLADAVTVHSTFLQRRYGGVIVRSGPNMTTFDPARYDRRALRDKWKIAPDVRLIVFTGTPRAYKGLGDLFSALDRVTVPNVRVLMAGKGAPLPEWGDRVIHLGYQPHSAMPELLAMADLVALPQRRNAMTEAQIPAKVFEAMAMARPIVASAMSDLPDILDGCGVIVDPEDVGQLAHAVQDALADPARADAMGRRAREKCLREYSWDAMEGVLDGVLKSVS